MKIAIFTNTYLPHVGGVANSVATLVEGMRQRGHACLVIAPEFPDQPDAEKGVVRVPSIPNFNGTDFSFKLPSGTLIGDSIKEFQPDLIHSHHPFLLGDAALRMAQQWDIPILFTHHTLYERYVHYVLEDSDWLERLAIELATEYANLCNLVVAPSKSVADLIKERGVEVPVKAIPTGIDWNKFREGDGSRTREKLGIPKDGFLVGHVGRLAEEKNLRFLFKGVSRYLEDCEDACFLIVGEGDSLEELQESAGKSSVGDRIFFAGKLTEQDLVDAYHAMNLFAFSSKSETQGMVLAEAMAADVPVVALDASGARDIVRDGKNGCLLPADASPGDFAEAISALRRFSEEEPDTLRASVEETAKAFSEKACLDELEEVYAEILEREPAQADLNAWTRVINRIEAEWDLAVGHVRALGASLSKSEGN